MDTERLEQLHTSVSHYASLLGRKPRACIVTFGCQMNARDSEKLRGVLDASGFEITDEEDSDFLLFNTCTVRENANTRLYGRLGKVKSYKRKNPMMMVAICGCMMQEPTAVEEIRRHYAFVDLIFGTMNLDAFPTLLRDLTERRILRMSGDEQRCETLIALREDPGTEAEDLPSKRSFPFKAGVNIMYGCDNFCSYCIVPYVRGRERSREPESILQEVRDLIDDGVREIMLLGQNVNSYGKTLADPVSFAALLERTAQEAGDRAQIRFMTSHPKDLSDELIDVMARYDQICDHLHLPVQAGSNRVLAAMNRHYTREDYLALVGRLRDAMPDLSITTDIMVGFPGEREEDIDQTVELIREAGFDNAFTFLYSRRTGTPAASMPGQIDGETAAAWFDRVLAAVHDTAAERCARFEGREMPVLVEQESRHGNGWLSGRISHNLLVHFKGPASWIGTVRPVRITQSKGFYLMGESATNED